LEHGRRGALRSEHLAIPLTPGREVASMHGAAVVVDVDPELQSLRAIVDELNRRPNGVAATQVGDDIHVALARPAELGGMPAYYGGRPVIRATVERRAEGLRLLGAVITSPLPVLFNAAGAMAAVLVAMAGGLILVAGDTTGVIAIIVGAIAGAGVLAGTVVMTKLARADEDALCKALASLGLRRGFPPGPPSTRPDA
jgi:glycosyltransferase involved in cell wall biosynthesis